MIKIRPYKHTDRYDFEKLVKNAYMEKQEIPPDTQKIIDTVGFYTSFPQAGKIYLIIYDKVPVGYCIVANIWKMSRGMISFRIEELYVNKKYKSYKPEMKLVEHLIKEEQIYSIEVRLDKNNSKKIFKFFDFERDFGPYFTKILYDE